MALTWSVHRSVPASVASIRVRPWSRAWRIEAGHPLDAVFGGAREVAEAGMRAHHHQHVGKALDQDAEIGLRPGIPLVLQPAPIDAPDIDTVETTGDRVEAGRVDDESNRIPHRWS